MDRRYSDKKWRILITRKKALKQDNTNYELILIDATETPIERPKKTESKMVKK